jgi:2-oxoisovalerate dehydrogenase E2 component (dihydrolipoyl transacylase)
VERAIAADVTAAPHAGERIPVRGVQRAMAQAMVRSVTQAPQVSIWKDIDMSASMRLLEKLRGHSDFAGVRLTPLTLAISAIVHGVKRCPELNARWHDLGNGEAEIERRRDINIGVAVSGPRGLVVPVLRDADRCSTVETARQLTDLTVRAREDRLSPQDSLGATITVTNIGVFDVDGGTPMLPPDQSGIVAMGRIIDRPWVVGGGLAVRPIMQVSVTFDHRIVDGATGAAFLTEVANFLTAPPLSVPGG